MTLILREHKEADKPCPQLQPSLEGKVIILHIKVFTRHFSILVVTKCFVKIFLTDSKRSVSTKHLLVIVSQNGLISILKENAFQSIIEILFHTVIQSFIVSWSSLITTEGGGGANMP